MNLFNNNDFEKIPIWLIIFLFLIVLCVSGLIGGAIVYFIWNWVLIDLIGLALPAITYFWQSIGLGILLGLVISWIRK